ncbi:alpha/beta hydrolase family protein [Paenibacillus daejeonensis]|uniref:alpha/beta hydrolase family protein n=1 Tax=Paenibacillus daejeonensis TaxID=135193 RepID=UPI00036FCC81|nr:alpha/beta hydrolase [Paenibacillus daejeonensis]
MSNQTVAAASFELVLSDKLKVKGRVRTLEDGRAKPVVVLAHGFRGFQDWGFWPEVAERFAALGYYAITFDYSRITAWEEGIDEATVADASTVSQDQLDLSALLSALHEGKLPYREEADANKTALLGHSRSGGSSIIYAHEHPEHVAAVIVWNGGASPVSDLSDPDLTPVQRAVALDQQANSERYQIARHVEALQQQLLIVQGDQDSARLLEFVGRLQETSPQHTYVSVPGGNHTFGVSHPYEGATPELDAAFEATAAFLAQQFQVSSESEARGA